MKLWDGLRKGVTIMSVLPAVILVNQSAAQQVYDDHEGDKKVHYQVARPGGKLDSAAANPKTDGENPSVRCAQFSRSRVKYDFIKLTPRGKFTGVESYASYDPNAPKFTMKVLTNAPVGTIIEIQLGKRKALTAYPDGTHSQYQGVTSTSGEWETVELFYSQTPEGSRTAAKDVDQLTILFNPNSTQQYVFYFDDITGPAIESNGHTKGSRRNRR